jgi:hypothetical protein
VPRRRFIIDVGEPIDAGTDLTLDAAIIVRQLGNGLLEHAAVSDGGDDGHGCGRAHLRSLEHFLVVEVLAA